MAIPRWVRDRRRRRNPEPLRIKGRLWGTDAEANAAAERFAEKLRNLPGDKEIYLYRDGGLITGDSNE